MRFTLILATYGRADELGRSIASLVTQEWRDFELLIVDQNPDERVAPYVTQALAGGLRVQHLRMAHPSLAGARNLGIKAAAGDFVAFPDDDCWYEADTLQRAAEALQLDSSLDGLVANWVEQSAARTTPPAAGLLDLAQWRTFRGGDASSISLWLSRDLLRRLDGFDERFGVGQWFGAAEEIDLLLRALALGARLQRCPAVQVHHRFGQGVHVALRADAIALMRRARGTGALYAKHRLGLWTVVRGLLAAPLLAALRARGLRTLVMATAQSAGRLQGMCKWLISAK